MWSWEECSRQRKGEVGQCPSLVFTPDCKKEVEVEDNEISR